MRKILGEVLTIDSYTNTVNCFITIEVKDPVDLTYLYDCWKSNDNVDFCISNYMKGDVAICRNASCRSTDLLGGDARVFRYDCDSIKTDSTFGMGITTSVSGLNTLRINFEDFEKGVRHTLVRQSFLTQERYWQKDYCDKYDARKIWKELLLDGFEKET